MTFRHDLWWKDVNVSGPIPLEDSESQLNIDNGPGNLKVSLERWSLESLPVNELSQYETDIKDLRFTFYYDIDFFWSIELIRSPTVWPNS